MDLRIGSVNPSWTERRERNGTPTGRSRVAVLTKRRLIVEPKNQPGRAGGPRDQETESGEAVAGGSIEANGGEASRRIVPNERSGSVTLAVSRRRHHAATSRGSGFQRDCRSTTESRNSA